MIKRWMAASKMKLFAALMGCLVWQIAQAGIPLWTITPAQGVSVKQNISKKSIIQIQYIVQNQSNKPKNLFVRPLPGLSQSSPCKLGPKGENGSSCTLILTVTGSAIENDGLHVGPYLCNGSATSSECYQPSPNQNSLDISVVPTTAILSLSGSPLMLRPTYANLPGMTGSITLTNTSNSVSATNVSASLPPDWIRMHPIA